MDDPIFAKTNIKFFSPRAWLNFASSLALLTILSVNFITYLKIHEFAQSSKWIAHTYQVINVSDCILINVLSASSLARAYVITGDQSYVDSINQRIANTRRYLTLAKVLTKDNLPQAARIASLTPLLEERFIFLQKTIEKKQKNLINSKETITLIEQSQLLSDKISNAVDEFNQKETELLSQRDTMAIKKLHNVILFNIITSVINIIILVAVLLLINRQLSYSILLEKQRKNTEIILKGIINGTNDFVAALDLDFRYIAFNKSYEQEFKKIFGKQITIGTKLQDALSHLSMPHNELIENWEKALQGESFTVQVEYGDPRIQRNLYEVTYNPILDETGNIIGAANSGRNVTERVSKENETKTINKELQEAYRELKQHDTNITFLNEMESSLQACSSINETFNIIATCCKKVLPFASGILYLMNNSRSYLEPVIEWGEPIGKSKIFAPDQCWSLRQGKIYKFYDTEYNSECIHQKSDKTCPSYLCVPLLAQNEIMGVLYLEIKRYTMFSKIEYDQLIDHNISIINNLAGQISLSLANIKLKDTLKLRSIRDPLTGLYNRSYLNESIERDIQRAKRSNVPITFVMIDLDKFKVMNDTYGHEAGDYILKQIGQCLQNQVRSSDIASRYGGEEFLIVFYDTDIKEGYARTEKLQNAIHQMELSISGKILPSITASFGISVYPTDGEDIHRLIDKADQALYQSKKTGRNKITVFDKSLF